VRATESEKHRRPRWSGATLRKRRSALNARRGHRHGIGAGGAGVRCDSRPGIIGRGQDKDWRGFRNEQKLFQTTTEGRLDGQLLFSCVLCGLANGAEFAGLAPIEGLGEGLADRKIGDIRSKHLTPSHHLHDVPDCAVGEKPGEQEGEKGKAAAHVKGIEVRDGR